MVAARTRPITPRELTHLPYGRPKETIEANVTAPDDPLDVATMTPEERAALKQRLIREHPDLVLTVPRA